MEVYYCGHAAEIGGYQVVLFTVFEDILGEKFAILLIVDVIESFGYLVGVIDILTVIQHRLELFVLLICGILCLAGH